MTECRRCERKAQLFICNFCIDHLRAQLRELPWWLDRLTETALGQVKLSDGGRRSTRRNVLHGDDSLASHIEPLRACKCEGDCECDLRKARRRRGYDALAHMLAAGRVNARASHQYDKIQNSLSTTIRDICETRGVDVPIANTASAMALWLARHVNAIASQDDAETFCDEIADTMKSIQRIINRPPSPRYLGPCPVTPAPDVVLEKRREEGDPETRCGLALTAPRDADEVHCQQCNTTHRVDSLLDRQIRETDGKSFTIPELMRSILPAIGEPVPARTLQHWAATSRMVPTGYSPYGDPKYLLGDVRRLRGEKPQKKATGAAARRKVG